MKMNLDRRTFLAGTSGSLALSLPLMKWARVHTLGGFSAHARQKDLLAWFSAVAPSKPRQVLTHGEDKARRALSAEIRKRFEVSSYLPRRGEIRR